MINHLTQLSASKVFLLNLDAAKPSRHVNPSVL